jgi:hypothetical protein
MSEEKPFSPGLAGIIGAETAIGFVDGANGKLLYRGIGTAYSAYDQAIDAGIPGNSVTLGREKRTRFIRLAVMAGRAKRLVTLLEATLGGATGVSIAATDDPIKKLRPYITTVAEEMGSLDNVRLAFGSATWAGLLDHPFLCGGGTGNSRRTVTLEDVARLLEIRPENILVVRHKALTSKQGKTAAKDYILGGTQVYAFGANDQPSTIDNGFGKSFYMELNGQRFDVVVDPQGVHGEEIYLRYFELMKATNSGAAVRLAITYT